MNGFLGLSRRIDALNEWVASKAIWLVLVVTLISAGNAVVRKVFNTSSNGWLEIQWYLFSAIFLLCAGYALKRNAHVRIDVLMGRFGPRVGAWVDIVGTLFFLFPAAILVVYLSTGVFLDAWHSGERSANQGGLIFWPARLLVPVGFSLLVLQGVSELIKRIGFLTGHVKAIVEESGPTEEEALAEEIRRSRGIKGDAQ